MGKGDTPRPLSIPREEYEKNYEAVFGRRKIKTWNPQEEDNDDYEQSGESPTNSGNCPPEKRSSGDSSVETD